MCHPRTILFQIESGAWNRLGELDGELDAVRAKFQTQRDFLRELCTCAVPRSQHDRHRFKPLSARAAPWRNSNGLHCFRPPLKCASILPHDGHEGAWLRHVSHLNRFDSDAVSALGTEYWYGRPLRAWGRTPMTVPARRSRGVHSPSAGRPSQGDVKGQRSGGVTGVSMPSNRSLGQLENIVLWWSFVPRWTR